MSPQASDSSKQLLAQAAQKLMEAVQGTGLAQPTPFAAALLELIECSAKLQEFDDMASEATTEQTKCEEAQAWQQIAQTTLKFARDGLLDQQQKALQNVTEMATQGASLHSQGAVTAPEDRKSPPAPPGVFLTPPPGLAAPPGLEINYSGSKQKSSVPPPGLETQASKVGGEKEKLPPWRRNKSEGYAAKASKSYKQATLQSSPVGAHKDDGFFADESFWGAKLNLDAFSD